ncbi:hypothetical protein Pyn_06678 [Prunus yedoensis var. nudiflora]|uniref:Reverse transcriptase zinc-binding domain-containing protein n=1 Tax=Prunus yedoensis var. nudiflora TaxID=2094558 RepID=A0A314UFE6_PRUYE|nr:hypothetical protein Pyn_06678 [Prunus yedoensis var. nudiflora]
MGKRSEVKVDNFLDVNGWQLDRLTSLLTQEICNNIMGIDVVKCNELEKLVLLLKSFTSFGRFAMGKLLTNSHRVHIGLNFDVSCPRCSCICEDLNHLFINCPESARLWRKLDMGPNDQLA